ncbi:hypothetical protein [Campylobacter volucris]|uniref:hypothetical protein n=1 Tax=Campylobacter volucris TaxID=1031542 RepID=UPI0014047B15|nr:hypothetical protein [Campylobacter volucris]
MGFFVASNMVHNSTKLIFNKKYGIINVAVSYVLILAGIMVLARIIKNNKT